MSTKGAFLVAFFLMLTACKGKSEEGSAGTEAERKPVETSPAVVDVGGDEETEQPMAPDFELKDLDGVTHRLSDYRGNVVIVDFWATYCKPCKEEIPHFIELIDEYGDENLAILGISLDGAEKAKRFMKDVKINYPVLLPEATVVKAFGGIKFIPTTFIIDPEGRIVQKYIGYRSKATFLADIKPYFSSE
jgi:cytochrome c biogenesis protein CcmG/thiol:disulfide interchange protein DsbE